MHSAPITKPSPAGALLVGLFACGPTPAAHVPPGEPPDAGAFSLSGYVLKGPVSDATVTPSKLRADLTVGDTLSTATTGVR